MSGKHKKVDMVDEYEKLVLEREKLLAALKTVATFADGKLPAKLRRIAEKAIREVEQGKVGKKRGGRA